MSVEHGSRSAWLVLAFGEERQYAGNTGYDDDLTETYRYDSNVANWRRLAAGDVILLRDREQLIGVAQVRRIESYPSNKELRRCPVCRTTSIKERSRREPRFRCSNRHDFPEPLMDNVRCTKLEARFEGSFRRAVGEVPIEHLRRACPNYTDQLSIQRLELPALVADLHRVIPGYQTFLAESDVSPTAAVQVSGETESTPRGAPPEGALGVPYRRPSEESLAGTRDPFEIDPAAVERANRGHACTQNLLADRLTALGVTPRSPAPTEPEYDLGWEMGDSLFVAEIKSVTASNEEKQLRLGVGQLLRYRHLLARGGRRVVGMLMLERAPVDRSWSKLCDELGIVLLWPDVLERSPAELFGAHSAE